MGNLNDVQRALRAQLPTDDMLKLVSTRVFLKTGVNLAMIKPEQNADPTAVMKVTTALAALGYAI